MKPVVMWGKIRLYLRRGNGRSKYMSPVRPLWQLTAPRALEGLASPDARNRRLLRSGRGLRLVFIISAESLWLLASRAALGRTSSA